MLEILAAGLMYLQVMAEEESGHACGLSSFERFRSVSSRWELGYVERQVGHGTQLFSCVKSIKLTNHLNFPNNKRMTKSYTLRQGFQCT